MVAAVLISFAVVFFAELGDKSQLMTMAYALRHRWWVVLTGVGIAATLVHGVSVTIGHFLGLTLPQRPIAVAAAIAFFAFAWWTWRESRGGDDEDIKVAEPRFVVLAIVSSFVLAELGDKTMLATVALASEHTSAGVWVGATLGMVLADAVAIAVGAVMHRRLPTGALHTLASLLFLVFGLWLLFDGALEWRAVAVASVGVVVGAAVIGAGIALRRRRDSGGTPVVDTRPALDETRTSEPSNGH